MEAANEAARRAVNGILDASNSTASKCRVWSLYQPWLVAPLRWHDQRRYSQGLPWDPRPPRILVALHWIAAVVESVIRRLRIPLPRIGL